MKLNLIVVKTNKLHELADFYTLLGLKFGYHKHEQGIFHYSTQLGETIFEIYPLPKKISEADTTTRLGFEVDNLDDLILVLKDKNTKIVAEPYETEFGYSAIVKDLDGRRVELLEKKIPRFKVIDIFKITNRGLVIVGDILEGTIKIGDLLILKNEKYNIVGLEYVDKISERIFHIGLLTSITDEIEILKIKAMNLNGTIVEIIKMSY
jgi:lactoylglutathione lyase